MIIPILLLLGLLLLGLPLYITLFGISTLLYTGEIPLVSTVISFQKLQSQEFISAIPLFTFAGYLLARSKSPDRIVKLFQSAFSFIRGGESAIVILIMAFFTALTGASGVSILALGGLMLPLLHKSGKGDKFSLGLITSSGSIGLLIAPSLPVIIFAIISSQNQAPVQIRTLFNVALVPSAILIGAVILYAVLHREKTNIQEHTSFSWSALWSALKGARWELPLPLIVYGGIYSGLFTVMEAAVITACYVFIIEFFLYKDLNLKKDYASIVLESMKLAGAIFIIMACAVIFTNYLVDAQIPSRVFNTISPFIKSKYMFLLTVNIFLLFTGCLMDIFSAIMIVLPILMPIVIKYGINPYHFAIIFLVNLEMGYMTPPVGMNLFIASYRFKKPITELYKAALPFLGIMLIVLMLVTYIPFISTFTLDTKQTGSVAGADTSPPSAVADLAVTAVGSDFITVRFTAPGDDGNAGTAASYDLRYLDMEITSDDDFDFAEEAVLDASPRKAGSIETLTITGLDSGTEYYISIKTRDEAGNLGARSPSIAAATSQD